MKKIIKLILLAVVIVGAVVALINVITTKTIIDGPVVSSDQAKEWQQKIDDLCKEGKWNAQQYEAFQTGIHTDRVTSNGDLLSTDEENALQKYLFAASCKALADKADKLFKQTSYPDNEVSSVQKALDFLTLKSKGFGADSNLAQAAGMLSEYNQLQGAFSFSSAASYSRPLRRFSGMSAESARAKIQGMKYYKTHFSKNPTFRAKIDNMASNRANAEQEYYMNLEKAIESHYRNSNQSQSSKLSDVLTDQEQFENISTNSAAVARLESFVRHLN